MLRYVCLSSILLLHFLPIEAATNKTGNHTLLNPHPFPFDNPDCKTWFNRTAESTTQRCACGNKTATRTGKHWNCPGVKEFCELICAPSTDQEQPENHLNWEELDESAVVTLIADESYPVIVNYTINRHHPDIETRIAYENLNSSFILHVGITLPEDFFNSCPPPVACDRYLYNRVKSGEVTCVASPVFWFMVVSTAIGLPVVLILVVDKFIDFLDGCDRWRRGRRPSPKPTVIYTAGKTTDDASVSANL